MKIISPQQFLKCFLNTPGPSEQVCLKFFTKNINFSYGCKQCTFFQILVQTALKVTNLQILCWKLTSQISYLPTYHYKNMQKLRFLYDVEKLISWIVSTSVKKIISFLPCVVYWNFAVKSLFVYFFTIFTHEKSLHYSSQNSEENTPGPQLVR